MNKRNFANWFTGYNDYSQHSESPDLFHFWTGVFTVASVLKRQVWIDQRYFQWTPNFYIVLVGPPGVTSKSTSLRLGTNLLKSIPSVKFGPRSMTWQGLTSALEEAAELVKFKDEFLPMSCLSCSIGELGTFIRPENGELIDVLVDLWDGQLETWNRQTQGDEGKKSIENPWVHIMGATTPSWLQENFTEAMIGGGLSSRIVWVYGDTKRQLIAYPADNFEEEDFNLIQEKLISDLKQIALIKGEYKLSKKAKIFGTAWYEKHWDTKPEHMISERYGGYIARKQSHIHKLAIVLAAAKNNELIITEEDLIIADQMTTGLEKSMEKVFQSIGVGDISAMTNELLAYVRAYRRITQKELWRNLMSIMSPKEFEEATTSAVNAGYIKINMLGAELTYIALTDKKS